jgi:hypothetical protein
VRIFCPRLPAKQQNLLRLRRLWHTVGARSGSLPLSPQIFLPLTDTQGRRPGHQALTGSNPAGAQLFDTADAVGGGEVGSRLAQSIAAVHSSTD